MSGREGEMGAEEILSELEGFYAYESGSTDSGAKNDVCRAELFAAFAALPEDEQRVGYARFLRNAYLSEEAIAQGYSPEDAYSFYCWFGWLT